jgi:DNA-binding MarR family transcriptional regulator
MNAVLGLVASAEKPAENSNNKAEYLSMLNAIERLHRLLLDVIKNELDKVGCLDINSVQALLLYNIGDAELTAGELRSRGYYLGSNVSYNLKKLTDSGYLINERSKMDKRSVRIRLTSKGQHIRSLLEELFERQVGSLEPIAEISSGDVCNISKAMYKLEKFWSDQIRYML